jgi:O-methyltransferase
MRMVKQTVRRALHSAGVDVVRYAPPELPKDFDPDLVATITAVQPFTMTTPELLEALWRSVRWVSDTSVPGAIVECGVWRGGSMMAAARTLLQRDDVRDLYLFDTFSGMPDPGDKDLRFDGSTPYEALAVERPGATSIAEFALAQLDDVQRNMRTVGYPSDRIHYVEGKVEDTIPHHAPEQIALLRLDTDWYESTRHELEHLFPRVSSGGIVIIDDYGTWQGARRAVDEYLAGLPRPLMLHRIDFTGRLLMVP